MQSRAVVSVLLPTAAMMGIALELPYSTPGAAVTLVRLVAAAPPE